MFTVTDPNKFHLLTENTKIYDINAINSIKKDSNYVKEYSAECVLDSSVMVKDISLTVSG